MSLWRQINPIREIHYFSDNMISARALRLGWISRLRAAYRFTHWLEGVGRPATMRLWDEHEAIFRAECAAHGGVPPLRILLTGASGFIGSHLRGELIAHGHHVTATDMVDGDLSDPETIRQHVETAPDVVVHLAASPGRVFGEESAVRTIGQNAAIAANVARACAAVGSRLVYASTSEIYGIRGGGMNYEGEPDGYNAIPHNLYGLSKRWGEEVSALYAPAGLQVMRVSMPYGPGLPSGRGRNAMHNFFWWAAHNERLRVHRGAARAWCWIGDTVRGIRAVIERGDRAASVDDIRRGVGVYNVGRDDNEATMEDIARIACRLVGADPGLIDIVEPGPIVSPVKRLLCGKLWSLGWRPTVDVEAGMAMTARAAATFPAVWS
jgi:nucleoside-diphosphate-sugar epimerase